MILWEACIAPTDIPYLWEWVSPSYPANFGKKVIAVTIAKEMWIYPKICPEKVQPFFKDCIYLFLERGKGREEERERNISVWLPLTPPTGDLANNPGMCPDWELNQQPFGSQASTQSTEPHQPEPAIVNITRMVWHPCNLSAKESGLECTCMNFTVLVSGGSRCHWVIMCTMWLLHSKWPSE